MNLRQVSKHLILSTLSLIGVATVATGLSYGLATHGLGQGLATVLGILLFIAMSIPIPIHFMSSITVEQQASFDSLTGLMNRAAFSLRFKSLLERSAQENSKFHILILDLNKFKQVNDTLGHLVGDLLLKHVAKQLVEAVRDVDTVARLGGDEFAILIPDPQNNKSYEPAVLRIIKAINSPAQIDGHFLYIGVSIGVATYPDTDITAVNLMRLADTAMYSAKRMQKDYMVYRVEDDNNNLVNLSLLGEMRKAIESEDFELWFQPKKNIKTQDVDSVECLIRWNHPIRGLLGPDKFVLFAEESGLIKYLTQFVIKQAAHSYKHLKEAGYDFDISVNVSPNDIVDPETMTTIIKSIVKADMSPDKFVLEVTETAIMHDPDSAFKVLVALESLGIKLSIDDFGTGHSSMTYLKNFPIHEVKIDQSFVRELGTSDQAHSIIKSTIELSHSLGATTVGEGVETLEIEQMLGELHCDFVQGYYIAKPMPLDDLIVWLNDYHNNKGETNNDNGL